MTRFLLGVALSLSLGAAACGSKSSGPGPGGPGHGGGGHGSPQGECIRTGCSGIICAEPGEEVVTTCEFRPEYACYRDARCERQGNGACGWTQTAELTACLANPPPIQ